MRAIKEELGDNDDDEDDLAALERKMQSAGMPPNVWKHAQRELRWSSYCNILFHSWTIVWSFSSPKSPVQDVVVH